MQSLSLETIPPAHIPFRFFLTAPWMGFAGALLLLIGSDEISLQRSPVLLAATHLVTLGFMTMVMLGAMFQLVPVISGRLIPGGTPLATLVHGLLLLGAALLAAGFYLQEYGLFIWAGPLLLGTFTLFLLGLGTLLLGRIGGGNSILCIRFAALSLLLTVILGLLRAANYAGLAQSTALPNAGNLHMTWGLGGWVLLLVMGASYQIIPMFHVTPSYPERLARAMPVVVFCALLLLSIGPVALCGPAIICLAGTAVFYGIYTIRLLNRRKRRIPDITARFWRLSLGSLIVASLGLVSFYFSSQGLPASIGQRLPLLMGILAIHGFAISVITGMLQKIVPFLSYLQLQRRCMSRVELLPTLPHMGNIIPAGRTRWQFRLHVAALLGLLLAAATGRFWDLAAILLAADFLWLGMSLALAMGLYHRTLQRIEAR